MVFKKKFLPGKFGFTNATYRAYNNEAGLSYAHAH